ncbi:VOC family protein [Rhodococcus erythropolis]|uniref:VOC family protein n=2 Tax=Rhodococcus TaxID=1827 RepID=UPI0009B921A8|nr:VOC family protein [Rhodococcus erythropolis]
MPVACLGSITLDCSDPQRLAEFWRNMLGGEITYNTEKFATVSTGGGQITAIRIDEHRPSTWPLAAIPKQIHLDLVVDDLDIAQEQAVSLGAQIGSRQNAPERCRVLLDPAGHPFCLCLAGPNLSPWSMPGESA